MLNANIINHDIRFAMDLLIMGLINCKDADADEILLMRATFRTLETLYKNIDAQGKKGAVL